MDTVVLVVAVVGGAVTILGNLGALVWGAATLNAAVRELRTVTEKLTESDDRQWKYISQLDRRLAIVEDRHGRPALLPEKG
ncbi:MAG TPA: hypothetical protein VNZ57_12730 [Longimicrobiales bacterium]|nr:hypothetical protein [Longimicrobiales bacterium]